MQAQPQQKAAASLPTVTVSKPLQREIIEWDEYTGRFEAVEAVEVRARVSGYLTELHFKDGQLVKQGDLLFVLDARPFERTLEQAQAELLQAQTRVQNTNLDVVRGKPLLERRIISEKTFDDRESLVREAQAGVKVAEAKVKTAELELSFTRITSPITGRISRTQVTAGNWVSAGGTANTTLLTTIVSQDPIYIYFDVERAQLHQVQALGRARRGLRRRRARRAGRGRSARRARLSAQGAARLPGQPARSGHRHAARPRRAWPTRAGSSRPACSRACASRARRRMWPSLLPDEAIGTDQTNKFVYVVGEDGSVARRNIKLGPLHEGLRVVREGVAAEEWVIIRGLQRARPGIKVTPKREALTLSEAPAAKPATKAQE